jgi:hypothetical protein
MIGKGFNSKIGFSAAASNSGWVNEEIDAMFHQYMQNKKIKIIPLLLDDVEVPPLLAGKKALDLKTNVNERIPELINMIKEELKITDESTIPGTQIDIDDL